MSRKGKDPSQHRREMEEVAGHAAEEHAADELFQRPEARSSRWPVALLLGVAAAGVVAWNVREARSGTAPLPAYEQERSLTGMVTVLARQIEGVRAATGAYPASLERVAPPLEGVSYRLTDEGYELEAVAGNVVVTFVSDRDPQIVAARVALPPGGPR